MDIGDSDSLSGWHTGLRLHALNEAVKKTMKIISSSALDF